VNGPRLLIINSEEISAWMDKGEVIPRYFNPGDVFDSIDLLLTNEDQPDPELLQILAGRARITVHNLPTGPHLLRHTLGYQPWLLRRWADGAVQIARAVGPDLVRCYGANLNAFAASEVRRRLGIRYAVSLHINPEVDVRARATGSAEGLRMRALARLERRGLLGADLVLPVYEAIVPLLRRIGVKRYEVAYNMLHDDGLRRKTGYTAGEPFRIIGVGRQIPEKRPEELIRAVAELPGTHLTLVGDGPQHDELRQIAVESGAPDRVIFERSVPNGELCARLPTFDLFATHSEYYELSKAVLEAFVTGLPVLLNRRTGDPVPELTPDICVLTEPTVQGYRAELERLIADPKLRERLGSAAAARAEERWTPRATETRFAEIYRGLLSR
jgi:glycosyltransferase involved in cell wall biosynthesis